MRASFASAALLVAAAIAAGCGSDIDKHGCVKDSDCDEGLVCRPTTGLCGTPVQPPEAPVNLSAKVAFEHVVLTWSSAARASSYEIYVLAIGDEGPPLAEGSLLGTGHETTFEVPVPPNWRAAFAVRSVGDGGFSELSQPAIVERTDPSLSVVNVSAVGEAHHIAVHWDPPTGSNEPAVRYALFASDVAGGPFERISSPIDGGPSGSLSPLTTRFYRVRAFSDHFAGPLSDVVSATTLPLPAAPLNVVARRIDATTIALSWDPVARAVAYDVFLDGAAIDPSVWTFTGQPRSKPAFTQSHFPTDGLSHTFAVRALTDEDVSPVSDAVPVLAVPPAPLGLTAEAGELRVQLRWADVPAAGSFVVSRGAEPTPLAEIATSSFLDGNALPESQFYSVQSRNAAGLGPPAVVVATAFPGADQSNPGSDPLTTALLDDAHSPAQTFVVGTGGLLKGIEIATACTLPGGCEVPTILVQSGSVTVGSAPAAFVFQVPCCGTPEALLPGGFHGSSYFEFGTPFPVSAGQHLRVVMDGTAPMLVGTTGDLYAGGSLEDGGRPAPDRDLVFRTEVLPATGDPARPSTPFFVVGVGQVEVFWTPDPFAVGYTVLRSTDGSNFTVAGTTTDAFFVDTNVVPGPVSYEVQATGSDGVLRVSTARSVTLPVLSLAASNLGVTGTANASDALGQTFTAEKTGDIFGIELAVGAAPDGSAAHGGFFVDVLDDAGTLLATGAAFGQVASCCGLPPDLSAGSLAPTRASFFPAVHATAGQRFELRLHPQTPLVAGTSADVYGGGTLTVGGVADPSRDLAFKVVMQ